MQTENPVRISSVSESFAVSVTKASGSDTAFILASWGFWCRV